MFNMGILQIKKLLLIATVLIIALSAILAGCTKYPETPEDVVKACYHALLNLDYEGYKSFLSTNSQGLVTKEEFDKQVSSSWEIKHFEDLEITKAKIENDNAQVELIIYYDQPSSKYADGMDHLILYLVKEQEQWKIRFK